MSDLRMETTQNLRIGIAAPNATTAFALERRLTHLRPTTIGRGRKWEVEIDGDHSHVDEVVAVVRNWLADEHLSETTLAVDGHTRLVRART